MKAPLQFLRLFGCRGSGGVEDERTLEFVEASNGVRIAHDAVNPSRVLMKGPLELAGRIGEDLVEEFEVVLLIHATTR